MRVIAGIAKGRRLVVPKGSDVRPTSDKVRGAIFNALWARGEPPMENARVLDLFAGSGALGIEALSRGAAQATFVERDRHALDAIRSNLDAAKLGDRAKVVARDAESVEAAQLGGPFDVVFADPPYALVPRSGVLARLARFLADGGIAIVEHDADRPPPLPEGLVATDVRRYGSTGVTFFVREES